MGRQQVMEEQMDDSDGPSKCSTFIYYTWKICTCIFSHIMLVTMVVTYCIAGAFTFEKLEVTNELKVKANISKIRHNVTRDLWGLTKNSLVLHQDNWTEEVKNRLKYFELDLLRSMKSDGWDGDENPEKVQWTFAGALFYSIIVITTIGYGHIAPKTFWGKIVTIFYAILGIPLMLLCLSNIGDIMAHSFRFMYWRVCCYVCTRKPKKPQFRRGRSIRGTVRQQGGGGPGPNRNSWRTNTTSSFRRSGRTSQRSADSALGLSDAMTRSTYSDTDYRYPDEGDGGGGGGGIQRGGGNRFSQHSRFSDTVLLPGHHATSPLAAVSNDLPLDHDPRGAPVLFNKYALDLDTNQSRKTPSRHPQQHLDIPTPPPFPPSPQQQHHQSDNTSHGPGDSSKSNSLSRRQTPRGSTGQVAQPRECRARIMSPMGFAISRAQTQRVSRGGNARMGRVREDAGDYYDCNDMMDYDYDDSSSGQRSKTKQVPIWLCVFLVVTYIFAGAFLFQQWEGWDFLDSAYFCFISLTTIGFGDFVPAQQNRKYAPHESIALCSIYLLFGIALLAMSFNLVQEEVIKNVKSVAKRLGILKDDEEDEE